MHIRAGILGAGRNIVNDEAEIMWIGGEANVVKRAVSVVASDKDRTAIEVARVFSSVAEGVDRPGSIICVRAEIVDARFIRRNWRLRGEFSLWLREKYGSAAGEHPGLEILRELQVHVRAGIFDVAIVNDKAELPIELRRIDPDIEVSAVGVVSGDEIIRVAKITVRIGGGEKWKQVPVRVIIVRAMVVNARFAGGNRRISLLNGGRLRGAQDIAAGELPVFIAQRRGVDKFIRPGIFRIAVVNDDADVLSGGSHAHIKESAETIAPGHLHGTAIEVGRVLSGVAE